MLEEERVTNRFNQFSLRVSKTGTDADLYPAFSFSSVGSIHSVVLILVLPRRSSQSSDSARILIVGALVTWAIYTQGQLLL